MRSGVGVLLFCAADSSLLDDKRAPNGRGTMFNGNLPNPTNTACRSTNRALCALRRCIIASTCAVMLSSPTRFAMRSLLATALFTSASHLAAQTSTPAPADPRHARSHDDETIVVTGVRREANDVLGGVSVVSGAELAQAVRPSIGETLAKQPGVSATSFGPAASRPILRGLGGDRIRILTDGIGSLDLSSSSADHAVAINPLTADRIDILRGPSALLFGSGAIGGVVNVIDSRIPRRAEAPLHADVTLGYGSAANERSGGLSLSVPVLGNFVLHGDAALSRSDDLRTGGYLLSDDLRDLARASTAPEVRALASLKGKLPNTKAESADIAGCAGLSLTDPKPQNHQILINHRRGGTAIEHISQITIHSGAEIDNSVCSKCRIGCSGLGVK